MKTIFNSIPNRLMSMKTSKNIIYFVLCAFAIMITSCNEGLEVEKTPELITYNTAEGFYGVGTSAAAFILGLYDSSNPNTGIFIMGFSTLPSSSANFKLDAGTYRLASTGAVKTFLPGEVYEENLIGTYQYNLTTKKVTFITGGSFTVSLSGNTYTIETDFTGEDAVTGNAINNIRIKYTGAIIFDYLSESIVESTYKATGTPKWLTTPGDKTWTGVLEPDNSGFEITNWANKNNISIFCDYVDGNILIDNQTLVAYNDTYNGYFRIAYISGEDIYVLPKGDYIINYNPSINILDFTGTVTDGGKTYEALAGVAAYNKTTGKLEAFFSDVYAGVKLQLTSIKSTSGNAVVRQSNSLVENPEIMGLIRGVSKSQLTKKATNIEVDKLDKTKIQKIPLKDLKVIVSSRLQPAESVR